MMMTKVLDEDYNFAKKFKFTFFSAFYFLKQNDTLWWSRLSDLIY